MKWNALRTLGLLFGIGLANLAWAADSSDEIVRQPLSDCKITTRQSLEELKTEALAANQGSIEAQNVLGFMYSLGCGVPQNDKYALIWFGLAADQGDAEAQFEVGGINALGLGTPIDYELAVKWYSLAADQGHAAAQGELGVMYANGRGVQQDKIVAYALFNLCAENSTSDTSRILENRANLAMGMSMREIKAADALTREMGKPGNLLKSIEHFITNSTAFEGNRLSHTAVANARLARPAHSNFLFCSRDGNGYINEETVDAPGWDSMWQRFMDRVLTDTKVTERFTEHDIRAKCASDAETLEHARGLLSHVDSRTTRAIYRRKPEVVQPLSGRDL